VSPRRPSAATPIVVAGVDGCRGRWLVVRRVVGRGPDAGTEPSAELVDDLAPLIDELRRGRLAALAVDMPIGPLDDHPRTCDVEARRLLGPRRSSVFPTPVRAVLDAVVDHGADYDEARRVSRAAVGVAPSVQAFNLVPAIGHLDRLVQVGDQDRLVEAHPELAFARLNDEPLPHPKRTAEGRALRRRLLVAADPAFGPLIASSRLPAIDLLDAAVLTITAARVVAGDERRLGDQRDRAGRRAEVVW
jgi:predicted RNase H-like nuclease